MLSYDYWRTRFDGDPGILGRTITVNDVPMTVIGVSARDFTGIDIGSAPQIRVPMMMKAEMTPQWIDLDNRRSRWVNVFGRVKPGVTMERAQVALQPYFGAILRAEVEEPAFSTATPFVREEFLKSTIEVLPGSQGRAPIRTDLGQSLWLLMAVVGGVLLIACANVAGLLTARSTSREKEIAIRLALGARARDVVWLVMREVVGLLAIGQVLGLASAWALVRVVETQLYGVSATDPTTVAAASGALVVVALTAGLVPAWRAARVRPIQALRYE